MVIADGVSEPFRLRIWDEHFQGWLIPDDLLDVRALRPVPPTATVRGTSYAVDVLLEPIAATARPPPVATIGACLHHAASTWPMSAVSAPPSSHGWPGASPLSTSAPPVPWLTSAPQSTSSGQPPPFLTPRDQHSHSGAHSHSGHAEPSGCSSAHEQALYAQPSSMSLEADSRDSRPLRASSEPHLAPHPSFSFGSSGAAAPSSLEQQLSAVAHGRADGRSRAASSSVPPLLGEAPNGHHDGSFSYGQSTTRQPSARDFGSYLPPQVSAMASDGF